MMKTPSTSETSIRLQCEQPWRQPSLNGYNFCSEDKQRHWHVFTLWHTKQFVCSSYVRAPFARRRQKVRLYRFHSATRFRSTKQQELQWQWAAICVADSSIQGVAQLWINLLLHPHGELTSSDQVQLHFALTLFPPSTGNLNFSQTRRQTDLLNDSRVATL
jgi:hypothetical protein